MIITMLLVSLLLIFFASIILSKGKGAAFLAGYNTMSDGEKAQYDEVALCKFMGKVMYGVSFSILLITFGELVEIQTIIVIGIVLSIALPVFAVVYSNTKNRFKKIVNHSKINKGAQKVGK